MSNFLRLNATDVTKGVIVAVLVAVLGALQQAFTAHGLNLGDFDWAGILNISVIAGVGYLMKNLGTSADGKFLGTIG